MRHLRLWLHGLDVGLQRPWVRRLMVGVVCGWALLATVGAVAVAITQASENGAIRAVDAQELHSCERNNVKTANDNQSHWADYNVFLFVDERFTVPTRSETASQKQITEQFAGQLQAAVAAKDWTPLTDCTAAVATSGSAYQAPQPIPFTSHGRTVPPPRSALDPVNAARPSPAGSVP